MGQGVGVGGKRSPWGLWGIWCVRNDFWLRKECVTRGMWCPGAEMVESATPCSLPACSQAVFNLPRWIIDVTGASPLPGGGRTSLTRGWSQMAAEHQATAAPQRYSPGTSSPHVNVAVGFRVIFVLFVGFSVGAGHGCSMPVAAARWSPARAQLCSRG